MIETAKLTFYFKTDEDPEVSALLQRKDGTIEKLLGYTDYDLGVELLKRLDTDRLSSNNEYSEEVLIPNLSLLKQGDTALITDEQIDALFKKDREFITDEQIDVLFDK